MSEQVKALGAIGGVMSSGVVDWFHPSWPQPSATKDALQRGNRLREGAPADAIELSMQPETIRDLPSTMYLKFMVDKADGRIIIQVIDSATDEVVRTVPPSKLRETLQGLAT